MHLAALTAATGFDFIVADFGHFRSFPAFLFATLAANLDSVLGFGFTLGFRFSI